jgi:GNAT-family acetyltransferase (TIGR03103 family)
MDANVALDLGWGRLLFGQTFKGHDELIDQLRAEASDRRDIALYSRDPHVLVAAHPDQLFIDPSLTFRLWMHQYRPARQPTSGVVVRKMRTRADGEAINLIYEANGMVRADVDIMWSNQLTETFTYLVAEDAESGDIIGTVTGVDHHKGFRDPESGSSLWCLAVDPQAQRPGVGQVLVRTLAERYQARGRAYMDLSVIHDNAAAIALYEKLGFERVPVFCVKRKNMINEPLFTARGGLSGLNPYAMIVADEARRRGITVSVIDAEAGYLALSRGGRQVVTRESLSELTRDPASARQCRHCSAGRSHRRGQRRRCRLRHRTPTRGGEAGPRRTGQGHHRGRTGRRPSQTGRRTCTAVRLPGAAGGDGAGAGPAHHCH